MRNASAIVVSIRARMRAGLGIAAVVFSTAVGADSGRAADLPVKTQIPQFSMWAGEVESSLLTAREFERAWVYFSAALDQKGVYAIGASWLPNGVTFGISTTVWEGSGCLSACPTQYTSSTFGRVGVTFDNTFFYAFGGLESRRDLFDLANMERSFISGGAGLSTSFGENGQFFFQFEQKTQFLDCAFLCSANLSSKSNDYGFRVGVRQDLASVSDTVKKILGFGRKEQPAVPVQPIQQPVQPASPPSRFNTPSPGDH